MGTATMLFKEGLIVSGSAADRSDGYSDYALVVTGSAIFDCRGQSGGVSIVKDESDPVFVRFINDDDPTSWYAYMAMDSAENFYIAPGRSQDLYFITRKNSGADYFFPLRMFDDGKIKIHQAAQSSSDNQVELPADVVFSVSGSKSGTEGISVFGGNVLVSGSFMADNRVGIGTTSPISELDVSGKIAITAEVTTPSQPADGKGYLYTKSDGKIYWRSHDVSEVDLTAAGGGGSGDNLSLTALKTSNYTAANWEMVLVNLVGASGDVTVTLPAASSNKQIAVKIAGLAMGKEVIVDGNSSETIDGLTTRIMNTDYESMHLISDGSNWWRIS